MRQQPGWRERGPSSLSHSIPWLPCSLHPCSLHAITHCAPHLCTPGHFSPAGLEATRTARCSRAQVTWVRASTREDVGVLVELAVPSLTWKVAMTHLRACWKRSSSGQVGCALASAVARWLWYRNQVMLSACRKGFSFPQALPRSAKATRTISGGCCYWV